MLDSETLGLTIIYPIRNSIISLKIKNIYLEFALQWQLSLYASQWAVGLFTLFT